MTMPPAIVAVPAMARRIGMAAMISVGAWRRPAVVVVGDVARLRWRGVGILLDRPRHASRQPKTGRARDRAEEGTPVDRTMRLHPRPPLRCIPFGDRSKMNGRLIRVACHPKPGKARRRMVTPPGFEPVAL